MTTEPTTSQAPVKNERAVLASFVFWLAALLGLDQAVKFMAFHTAWFGFLESLRPAAGLMPFFNYNFAFSLPLPEFLMYIIYGAVLAVISRYLLKEFYRFNAVSRWAWLLILAGALSNIFERVTLGYVRDFVYIFTGIFNLADGYIIAGIIILLAQSIKHKVHPSA